MFAALAIGVTGCGEPEDQQEGLMCVQEFSASVRQGPSAGLELYGILVLGPQDGADVPAVLQTADGDIAVAGTIDEHLVMTFTLPDGTEIRGSDPNVDSLADCPQTLEGDFTGPKQDDGGDWISTRVVTGANGTTYTSFFDGMGVVVKIIVTNALGQETTLCNTNSGFSASGVC